MENEMKVLYIAGAVLVGATSSERSNESLQVPGGDWKEDCS